MAALDRLYAHLPLTLQHTAVSAYGLWWRWLRFGPGFEAAVAEFRLRDRADPEEIERFTARRLREVLAIAADEVPFYRERWDTAERRAAHAGQLCALPLLSKAQVRATLPERFERRDRRPRPRLVFHTSGSTGTPIATVWTRAELTRSIALREVRSAGWAGVSFRQPRATFSGRLVEPEPRSTGPFYRYNAAERQVYLSAFHLGPHTAQQYVDALVRHRVRWLTGYTMSFFLLARSILEQNIVVPPLDAVVTTSEKLTPEMRSTMEQAFACRVFEEYGTVENTVLASECEAGSLHLSPEAGVVEILRPDGTEALPGEVGEIVTTGLLRDHQPLVRYRVGDLARRAVGDCPCGRALPRIAEVVGRAEDAIFGSDGRRISQFYAVFWDLPGIAEAQIEQPSLHRLLLRVVPAPGFAPSVLDELVRRMAARVGPDLEIEALPVDEIPRSPGGKFRAVISHVQPPGEPALGEPQD